MKKITTEYLKEYFEAPEPLRKQEFLQNLDRRPGKISLLSILQIQFHYISKLAWIVSLILFLVALSIIFIYKLPQIGTVCSLIPFVVLISLCESMRSYRYGMEELELSAPLSLKNIILARLFVLGVGNLMELMLLAALCGGTFYEELLLLLVPYLVTAGGGNIIIRKCPGRDGTWYCCVFATIVACLEYTASLNYSYLYSSQYRGFWLILVLLSLLFALMEGKKTIKLHGGLLWN